MTDAISLSKETEPTEQDMIAYPSNIPLLLLYSTFLLALLEFFFTLYYFVRAFTQFYGDAYREQCHA